MKRAKPATETEALMMAAPGEPIEDGDHPLTDAIEVSMAAFLATLSDLERDIVVMSVVGKLSIREISAATGLSKSDVHRRLPGLMDRLAEAFQSNPEIMEYLNEV